LTSPVKTRAHDWPAGAKLAALCGGTLVLFFLTNPWFQLAALLGTMALYAVPGRLFLKTGLRALKVLWPFLLVVGIWHLWEGSHAEGATILMRMITMVALANLVTMTTRLSDMIAVVQTLVAPLRRFGVNTRAFEIAMAMVIRMVPVLFTKASALIDAWKARSRRRPGWRIVFPFLLLALDDADHVSDALRARGGLLSPEET
jgi:biotin transport system permease protein